MSYIPENPENEEELSAVIFYDHDEMSIAEGVISIGCIPSKFDWPHEGGIHYISLPNSLTTIREKAFINFMLLLEIELPENLLSIGNNAFAGRRFLRGINIPGKCTSIGDEAFLGCFREKLYVRGKERYSGPVETLKIPDSVTLIGEAAFLGCGLREIHLPKNITKINDSTFQECPNLTRITIPENVVSIGTRAFFRCSNLRHVKIPDNVTSIGEYAFTNSRIEEVTIPKHLTFMGDGAFRGCEMLHKIELHTKHLDMLKRIISDICQDLDNEKQRGYYFGARKINLVIKYENYEDLLSFMQSLMQNKDSRILMSFSFIGEPLTSKQKISLKMKFGILNSIKFEEQKADVQNQPEIPPKESIPTKTGMLTEEIKKILNEINCIIDKLPEEIKDIVDKKVQEVLEKYYKDKKTYDDNQKPKLDYYKQSTIELKIEEQDPESTLMISLINIKQNLISHEKLLENISLIDKYEEVLESKIDTMPEKTDNLEEIIKAITYLVSQIDPKTGTEILNKTKSLLTQIRKMYENDLNNIFDDSSIILALEAPDIDKQLKIDLLKILQELIIYYDKTLPYIELLEVLKAPATDEEIKSTDIKNQMMKNDVKNLIIKIKYLIPLIDNSEHRKELEQLFNSYIEKYIKQIEYIIKNHGEIKEDDYRQMELEMIEDIYPISIKINLYATKDEKEQDILEQLESSIEILNNNTIANPNEKKVITSLVVEIHNKIINNSNMSNEDKQKTKEELLKVINDWITKIKTMNGKEDENEVIMQILKDISKIKITLEMFLDAIFDYNNKRGR